MGGLGATSGPWATAEGWPCSTRRCPHEPLAPSAPPPCADGRGCRGQLPLTARSPLRPPRPHVHPLPSPLSQFLRQKRPQAYAAFVRHCPQLSILKISNLWKRLKKHLAPFARLASPVVRIWQPAGRLWSTLSLSLCRSPQGSSEPPEGKLKTPYHCPSAPQPVSQEQILSITTPRKSGAEALHLLRSPQASPPASGTHLRINQQRPHPSLHDGTVSCANCHALLQEQGTRGDQEDPGPCSWGAHPPGCGGEGVSRR